MTIGTAQLSEALQTLIDARLDTIDRMLLGRVPRRDRVAIVREVESQVFELLHDRGVDEFTREDVLVVLGRLDPPEAYLPDEDADDETVHVRPRPISRVSQSAVASNKPFRIGKAGGILGISAIGLVLLTPLFYLTAAATDSVVLLMIVLFGLVFLSATASALGICFSILGRRDRAWAVTGLITSAISLLIATTGGILLVLDLANQ